MEKRRRIELIALLGDVFGEDLGELRIAAYLEATSSLSLPRLEFAVREAVKTLKFFPKPVELRELAIRMPGPKQPPKELPEKITPPEEAKKKLREIFEMLNGTFGTNFKVDR